MEYRFKFVRSDGTHYFKAHNFSYRDISFSCASIWAEQTADIDQVDVYEENKKIGTFYK